MTAILFGVFAILVLLNVPVAVSLGLATITAIAATNTVPLMVVAQKLFTATDSFPLMAIPFFMIAGSLMEKGGISRRLIRFANALVGSLPGGLALVTVLASMFFAAISGSSPATVAAIGSIMIPAMVRQGYAKDFATATQASSGYIGVIIPPSIPMVTYGVVTGASIGALFMAGFVPGILIGAALMTVAFVIAKKNGYVGEQRANFKEVWTAFKDAFLALLMPVIILGGIYGGVFTPTEAANVAVIYGLVVGMFVYRELKWSDIPAVLRASAISTAMVMLIIATASAFGLLLTREMIPNKIANFFIGITDSKLILLILINLMLLVVGTFMETNAAIIILAPIFFPVIIQMGIDPIHFGVIMVINLAIGMITPPLGVNLFVACGLTKLPIERIIKANWAYLFVSLAVLALITYFPALSLWLPNLLQ
ncbi:TRAP transporter large permease [Calderihabitans maritimus]|uniref:TRAP C4-dicarboxylate transport system permease DctM n=1 Tax=Calderihabitans maritimus TaxID=1246530 RepID=A0A1Z5HW94_9FIRM|nr:TRAP transporter large permease [Calderihabitans maritimus]GAW93784.1 TRAP C4-dicarboxylate transport system permease DctM [Calderihabitans maritimus]